MNLGIVEQHPERESFVVERFSADLRAWRNGTTTALKRSTTNLRRFMVPMCAKTEWRLPMNLPRPPPPPQPPPPPSPSSSPPQRGRGNTEVARTEWDEISSTRGGEAG